MKTTILSLGVIALTGSITSAQCNGTASAKHDPRMMQIVAMDGKNIVETAAAAGQFSTLLAAAQAAGLAGALASEGPLTVFAPTDAAFAALPKGTVESLLQPENRDKLAAILSYHVVPGNLTARDVQRSSGAVSLAGQRIAFSSGARGTVKIDGATVTKADIACENGTIHVIDRVILPEDNSIVGVASEAGSFGTLLAAAKAAGLADLLGSEGPFTVFAPTDSAFEKLPAGTVESLLKPENRDQLVQILTYHVVPGRVFAADAVAAGTAASAEGRSLRFSIDAGRLTVDGVSIIATDIDASNGVVHVIDSVILP